MRSGRGRRSSGGGYGYCNGGGGGGGERVHRCVSYDADGKQSVRQSCFSVDPVRSRVRVFSRHTRTTSYLSPLRRTARTSSACDLDLLRYTPCVPLGPGRGAAARGVRRLVPVPTGLRRGCNDRVNGTPADELLATRNARDKHSTSSNAVQGRATLAHRRSADPGADAHRLDDLRTGHRQKLRCVAPLTRSGL